MTSLDSFKCRKTLKVGAKTYAYYSLPAAEKNGLKGISRLPFSMKVLLENLLRNEDGRTVKKADIDAFAKWLKTRKLEHEIAFRPARVLMQDFTGVPAVVDLAAMRDAMQALGGDAEKINPLVPVDLVIDHSVIVNFFGNNQAFKKNVEEEYKQNQERYEFLKWGQTAFSNFSVVPPGTGICHQVNLEYLAQTVWTKKEKMTIGKKTGMFEVAYPDTLVGTDSHTTMVNGLAVLGWGVGGIEAEAAMLGQPLSMLLPEVIGFKLHGPVEGRRHRDRPRAHRDADAAQEGRGRQVRRVLRPRPRLPVGRRQGDDRQHGAGIRRDLRLLPGRQGHARLSEDLRPRVGARRAGREIRQGAGHVPHRRTTADPVFTETLDARPRRRRAVAGRTEASGGPRGAASRSPSGFAAAMETEYKKALEQSQRFAVDGRPDDLGHGDVVIAAITSCTNTSNPSVLIGAGLLARNAAAKGLKAKPWVKTSLAPGSQVVAEYLANSGLQKRSRQGRLQPRRLRLHHLHRQFRPAAGRDFEVDQRQRHHRRRGAVRQPQLRRPRQPGRAGELSRLAAAGRRLCARRLGDARISRSSRSAPARTASRCT